MAITGAVLSVGAVGGSVYNAEQQRKANNRARRANERANRIEKAKANVERAVERRRAFARARQAQAFNLANATQQGVLAGSSGVQGANSSLFSNLASSLASQNRSFVSGMQALDLRQSAQNTLAKAQVRSAYIDAGVGLLQTGGSMAFQAGLAAQK